jgi:SAM-dependent methyltransferase
MTGSATSQRGRPGRSDRQDRTRRRRRGPDLRVRARTPELMDRDGWEEREIELMYVEMARINRWLGGHAVSLGHLRSPPDGGGPPASVLDVGAGAADLAAALVRDSASGGPSVVALDLHPSACRVARRVTERLPAVRVVAADAFRLPFAERSFDLVHCALFLHHFHEREIGRLLGEMLRVSRRGVLVNDLHRHPVAYHGIRLLTRLFARSRLVRADAPLSVRRGFLPGELETLAEREGLRSCRLTRHWAYRLALWIPAGSGGAATGFPRPEEGERPR